MKLNHRPIWKNLSEEEIRTLSGWLPDCFGTFKSIKDEPCEYYTLNQRACIICKKRSKRR